jgi:hypothetical protein
LTRSTSFLDDATVSSDMAIVERDAAIESA